MTKYAYAPIAADMIRNLLRRNDTDGSSTLIVHQSQKHFASKLLGHGFKPVVSEELENIALVGIVCVELGRDTLDKCRLKTGRYCPPPLVCDCATGKNQYQAPRVVVTYLVDKVNKCSANTISSSRTLCI